MPIGKFQSGVLRLLAAQRSPDSYVAGGIAINRHGPRYSADIDIFHDSVARQDSTVTADEAALAAAGYVIAWPASQRTGKHEATIGKGGERMLLEWVTASAFRFFPTQPDDLFGYVPHPVDLATNKASAAADRRVPRDIVDLVTIHETILPAGAVVAAACGKFIGMPRKARKRGGGAARRGLSAEQIPAIMTRDRQVATTDAMLPGLNRASRRDRHMSCRDPASRTPTRPISTSTTSMLIIDGSGNRRAASMASLPRTRRIIWPGAARWRHSAVRLPPPLSSSEGWDWGHIDSGRDKGRKKDKARRA